MVSLPTTLGGDFNPIWKYACQIGHLPQEGVKTDVRHKILPKLVPKTTIQKPPQPPATGHQQSGSKSPPRRKSPSFWYHQNRLLRAPRMCAAPPFWYQVPPLTVWHLPRVSGGNAASHPPADLPTTTPWKPPDPLGFPPFSGDEKRGLVAMNFAQIHVICAVIMLCYVMLCDVMWCYVVLCDVMLCDVHMYVYNIHMNKVH